MAIPSACEMQHYLTDLPVQVIDANSMNAGIPEAGKTSSCKFQECPGGTYGHQPVFTAGPHGASFHLLPCHVYPAINMNVIVPHIKLE